MRHTLDAFAIPYAITNSTDTAVQTPEMIIVAGQISGADGTALLGWAQQSGHTVWLSELSDKAFLHALGLSLVSQSSARTTLQVDFTQALASYADTPEEQQIALSSEGAHLGYSGSFSAVATYADGSAGIADVTLAAGHVIIFGTSFANAITRFESGAGATHGCTNVFAPSLDTTRLFFRRGYELYTKTPVVRAFAPNEKRAAVILTHDMDATVSFPTWQSDFMPVETAQGWLSTLNVDTSYRDTGWFAGFYADPQTQTILQSSLAAGFDIESHSVSHMPDFNKFPLGDAMTDPAQYSPTWSSATQSTTGGAVRPEMLISAALLRNDFSLPVRGFRSGYLLRPRQMATAEVEASYVYDSSHCIGEVGGALPYLALSDDTIEGAEVPLLELPLSIGDQDITTRSPADTLAIWQDITEKNANNGAPTIILVHPTNPETKLWAYQQWIAWLATQPDLWVGPIDGYYEWYQASGIRSGE